MPAVFVFVLGGEGGIGCDTSLYLAPLTRGRCALQIVCPDDLSNPFMHIEGSSLSVPYQKRGLAPLF